MANNIGEGSYARYDVFDSLSYLCIDYLMDNDEMVWKLLKYNTPDAWNKPDLTKEEKAALIYNGGDNTALYSVFMDSGQPDVQTAEKSEIRIYPYDLYPDNRVWGTIKIMFEIYANYHVNTLSNYRTRVDMIAKRFLQVFNGAEIGGIGRMHFDVLGTYGTRLETGGQLPWKGRWMIMGNKSA
jgi:hypothetical protein